jgi:hypothetical protein
MPDSPFEILVRISKVFDRLKVPHVVVGSLASSAYGIPRTTQGADIVADLQPQMAASLARALQGDFYANEDMIRQAIQRRRSFNVIHIETVYKADIFPVAAGEWGLEEMGRARILQLGDDKVSVPVASPEDVILHKLLWYKEGGEVSDRQWGDILGVLKVQGEDVDRAYLHRWAGFLRVQVFLQRALEDAGLVSNEFTQ